MRRMPSVLRTVRVLPIWQVGLPFSRSLMKRMPVPDARASSACVRPSALRSFWIKLPSSSGVNATGAPFSIPDREYYRVSGHRTSKILLIGNIHSRPAVIKLIIPEREETRLRSSQPGSGVSSCERIRPGGLLPRLPPPSPGADCGRAAFPLRRRP